jgi:hypothetical protein
MYRKRRGGKMHLNYVQIYRVARSYCTKWLFFREATSKRIQMNHCVNIANEEKFVQCEQAVTIDQALLILLTKIPRPEKNHAITQVVTRPDTNRAQCCLTWVISHAELGHSTCYRRWLERQMVTHPDINRAERCSTWVIYGQGGSRINKVPGSMLKNNGWEVTSSYWQCYSECVIWAGTFTLRIPKKKNVHNLCNFDWRRPDTNHARSSLTWVTPSKLCWQEAVN